MKEKTIHLTSQVMRLLQKIISQMLDNQEMVGKMVFNKAVKKNLP
jgi:hypothetical protein